MSRTSDEQTLNALLRSDFYQFLHRCCRMLNPGAPFLPNWHLEAIAYRLDQVRRGEITRLIINLPPRHLKSIAASVAFPAFLLGHDPTRRIICLSYGADLSSKHAADFRAIVQSSWYRRAFRQMNIARVADSDVHTTKRGFRKTTSVGGALTGLGGNCVIIDDPQKPIDAQSQALRDSLIVWFTNTLMSRLDNKETAAVIVVMQRVHLHDLAGYLLESSDRWTILNLAAIAEEDEWIPIGAQREHHRRPGEALHPEHESLKTLELLRRELGTEVFAAQYQQSPVPPGGAMIQKRWLGFYDAPPERTYGAKVIQSWDCASKAGGRNDWSVCTTWLIDEKRHYYLLDVTRGRYEYPELKATAIALAERFKPTCILIEDASTGIALAQELREAGAFVVKAIPIERDKFTRLWLQQAKFEAGLVHFPRNAPWLSVLETELLTFPQAKHDDQVDSISQALAFKAWGYDTTMQWANYL